VFLERFLLVRIDVGQQNSWLASKEAVVFTLYVSV